jgi:hypothetical protein
VQAAYYASAQVSPLPVSQLFYTSTGSVRMPELDSMYMYDLFLESYTLPSNGADVQGALHVTARYVNAHVKITPFDAVILAAAVIAIAESKTAAAVANWAWDAISSYPGEALLEPVIEAPSINIGIHTILIPGSMIYVPGQIGTLSGVGDDNTYLMWED